MIRYLQRQGARICETDENPCVAFLFKSQVRRMLTVCSAEYMLDVIGAGATALSEHDWSELWKCTPEAEVVKAELDSLRQQGAETSPPPSSSKVKTFTTSWAFQLQCLLSRNFGSYWRDPVYILAKMALNIVGGLFIGFTFYKAKNSQQGVQNQLFSIFMATVLAYVFSHALVAFF